VDQEVIHAHVHRAREAPSRAALPDPVEREERIRAAALEGFAREGIKATTIRSVAAAAGVSPGLVQHYFPSKAALRQAVDDHVADVARAALDVREVEGDLIEDLAERITALVANHFLALLYVARGVAERDGAALAIFDTLTELCRTQLAELQRKGMLRPDLDLEWAALHTVLINLGTVVMEPGVSRQIGAPFLTESEVERWKRATTALFVAGELRSS
jgi:TetR/AcrR family transcriptional regulator, regulator of cefoperazone and chloramphenicol sensitivity